MGLITFALLIKKLPKNSKINSLYGYKKSANVVFNKLNIKEN